MRRRLLRILVLMVILLLLAAGAIQCVLWSDWPRQIVITQIEQATGLRVDLEGLETGWSGHTTLRGLRLALPTETLNDPLLWSDVMQVDHASLLRLLLTRDLDLRKVSAETEINLRQDTTGKWDWQRAVDLIASHADPNAPPAALPQIEIYFASVNVVAADGRSRVYPRITFDADPMPPTAWRVKLSVGDQLALEGRVNPAGEMHHELTLTAQNLDELLTPFVDTADLAPASGKLHVIGDMRGTSYTARLDAKQIHLGKYQATGTLSMTIADTVTFAPIALDVTTGDDRLGKIQLSGGRIARDGPVLQATALQASARNTIAQITGTWNLLESRGSLAADWIGELPLASPSPSKGEAGRGIELAGDQPIIQGGAADENPSPSPSLQGRGESQTPSHAINHHGSLTAELRKLAADRWHLETTVNTRGSLDAGQWDVHADLLAEGDPAGELTWSVDLDRGRFAPIGGNAITLDHADLSGRVDVAQRRWKAAASIDDFKAPGDDRSVDIKLTAAGDDDKVTVERLKLTRADGTITATGEYTFADDAPLNLEAVASFKHTLDDPSRPDVPPWTATAEWTGTVGGAFGRERDITAAGTLEIEDLSVNGQALKPISITSKARWNGGELSLSTEPFEVLGGTCAASGAYTPDTMTTQLKLTLDKITLSAVSAVVNPELKLEGLASVELQVHVPRGLVDHVRAEGDWEVESFHRGAIIFDRMTGRLSTRGKVLRLDPIVLLKDTGRAEGRVLFNLQDGHTLRAELNPQRWPLDFEAAGLSLAVDGAVAFDVDVTEQIITGTIDLQTDLAAGAGNPLGRIAVGGEVGEKSLKLSEIHGTLGSGEVGGEAIIDLADWSQSAGLITLKAIAPTALSGWQAPLAKIDGKLDATIKFAPAPEPRAPEPLRLDVNWSPADEALVVERLHFGAGSLIAYVSPKRSIIDESTIALAKGQVKAWASFSPHAGQWYNHLRLALHDLDTNILAEAVRTEPGSTASSPPSGKPVPGKLSGHFNAIGPVGDWQALVGRGELTVAESNFVNTDILGGIMRLIGSRPTEPVGRGRVEARLERGMILIDQFKYANRSTEILLDGVIQDIAKGMQSPVRINALATVRPFKGLPIIGTGDIDRMIRGFESGWSSVRVTGTLEDPTIRGATFAETTSTLKKLLTDQQQQ